MRTGTMYRVCVRLAALIVAGRALLVRKVARPATHRRDFRLPRRPR